MRGRARHDGEIVPIGAPGFEPGTSPTRTVRATRLRHAPRAAIISEAEGPAIVAQRTAPIAFVICDRVGLSWSVRVPFGPLTIAAGWARMLRSVPSFS